MEPIYDAEFITPYLETLFLRKPVSIIETKTLRHKSAETSIMPLLYLNLKEKHEINYNKETQNSKFIT